MRDTHPQVRFQIVEEMEDLLLEALKSGEIDIAVSPEPYVDDEIMLATQDTLHDIVHVYARPSHPLAGRRSISLEDAAMQDWVLPPPATPIGREWLRRFHGKDIEPRPPALVSRSISVVAAAARSQDLLCWLPQPRMPGDKAGEGLVRIDVPGLEWSRAFRVYRRRKGLMTPSAALLVHSISQLARHGATSGE